ncbi:cytochrome b5 domain-containing protein [Paenibacillus illinoisensis]|uniref:Cytochrome B5 n=1 Tax=Paenibacillus illinoisensis TaxID=59845 RepID=A0A2W0CDS0_9BACL|nr:cytochrome b5 domain-containing protein [Paenibacillus illinoisensis]PYY25938.1 Cytochrome B5 [Paenibacillus illinoisensis]
MNRQLVQEQMNSTFSEIQFLIRLLYTYQDVQMKNLTLNQLWNQIAHLQFLIQLDRDQSSASLPSTQAPSTGSTSPTTSSVPTIPAQTPVSTNQRNFTRQQLAEFNGKNGKPAYVAVNEVVYNVTNNAAWSAGTHFGLTAGQDWTGEFASCHAAEQWILNTLTPVGRLTN